MSNQPQTTRSIVREHQALTEARDELAQALRKLHGNHRENDPLELRDIDKDQRLPVKLLVKEYRTTLERIKQFEDQVWESRS